MENGKCEKVCVFTIRWDVSQEEDLFAAGWDIVPQICYLLLGSFSGKQELKWREVVSNCCFQAWQAAAGAGGIGGSTVKSLKCWLSQLLARYLIFKLEDTQRFSLGAVSEIVYNSFLCCVWMKYFVSHEMYSQSQGTAEREAVCTWSQTSSDFAVYLQLSFSGTFAFKRSQDAQEKYFLCLLHWLGQQRRGRRSSQVWLLYLGGVGSVSDQCLGTTNSSSSGMWLRLGLPNSCVNPAEATIRRDYHREQALPTILPSGTFWAVRGRRSS